MTMTRDEVEKLLDGTTPGPWKKRDCDVVVGEGLTAKTICHFWRHWSNDEEGIEQTEPNAALTAASPDLARSLLAAYDEIDRLRADAGAAVALVVEKAADSLLECCVWCDSQPRTDDGWRNGVRDARKHGMTAIRALAPVDGLAMVEALRTERDELKAQKWDVQHTDTMNDIVSLGMERDRLTADLAAAQAQIEALRGAPFPDETGFYGLIGDAMREAEKAMRKFPQPNYVISKVAEEAGEVVKAAIHCAEGRETAENLRGEMKQLIAMLYRLWVEGDGVHGLPSVRAALSAKDS